MTDTIRPTAIAHSWDGSIQGTDGSKWNGWLDVHSENFDGGVADLKAKLDEAFLGLAGDGTAANPGDPSNPAKLAAYQTALSEYNLYRMLQSNSSKNLADMQKQNARNI